ncbi:exodeoxyribonuclease VII small subunit [Candidatus Saccharibacteria bacterium]|nr:exodeoxyribonuclease VII small subunit [Candidatus Saccharibacteria bacterium]
MTNQKNISEKMSQLEEAVTWFNSDDFKLEEVENRYKDAIKLATEIEKDLDNLKNKITVLKEDFSK